MLQVLKWFLFNHTTLFSRKGLKKSLCDSQGTIFEELENPVSPSCTRRRMHACWVDASLQSKSTVRSGGFLLVMSKIFILQHHQKFLIQTSLMNANFLAECRVLVCSAMRASRPLDAKGTELCSCTCNCLQLLFLSVTKDKVTLTQPDLINGDSLPWGGYGIFVHVV